MAGRMAQYAAAAIMAVLLIGCAAPVPERETAGAQVTDQLGRTVALSGEPQRIISLAPSNTEILFTLGLGDRVVGVTDYCKYPPEAREKPSIGGFSTPDIERIVALSPDLILATSIHEKKIIPQLEARGMTVIALDPKTIEEIAGSINLVGGVTGRGEAAAAIAGEIKTRVQNVVDRTSALQESRRPRVFYIVWHDPLMSAGNNIIDELIQKAGGENIARDLNGYAGISLEAVVSADPEVIIAGVDMGSGSDLTLQFALTDPRLGGTSARRNNRIYSKDTSVILNGPRIVGTLEDLARLIQPEIFGARP